MKNILIVNPIATDEWNEYDKEYFMKNASEMTNVYVTNIDKGPKTIESVEDEVEAVPGILKVIKENKNNYDGFLINCFLGPGVEEARKFVSVPVIGPGITSFYIASLLCDNFGIISPGKEVIEIVNKMVHSVKLENKFAGVVELNLGVDDLLVDTEITKARIISAVSRLIDNLKAEAIIFGCTGLVSFAEEIKSEIDVPLIEPAAVSLKVLEMLTNLRT
ncbi:aspartate/glutamate racemase family protein [Anaerosalibacter bizertensis]|uniref:Aspartate/glutamate racemase family protein n=2 Tax=cellular organisms TaxID=131567 RepID=A0A9Q4ADW0_9FIRM|nr:aspartate/glutamate racemase family protein [Anaerosalibacter bizertensis]MCB5560224.1 aspartate/glutamate racemase family protein [Anaerosalibacter bizertensis]MCG4565604.1 aspartate/glutamate racemase family protein [Anaerosalibacter bizertensis]MCG4585170.1 aspartate/glutamate racemase family protein [Anaerosalibacter bizertensis]